MDSKLKLGRKVLTKMTCKVWRAEKERESEREREREREREKKKKKKKKKGAHSMYAFEHYDACSVTVNKVDLGEQGRSRQ